MSERNPVTKFFSALFATLFVGANIPACTFAEMLQSYPSKSKVETQYARDRQVDILHVALDVTPDFEKRTVRGEMTMTFKALSKPVDELRLDAVDLTIDDVKCTAEVADYQVTDKEIVVTFKQPIALGQENKLTVKYSAQPERGLYFRVPSNGYKAADTHIFSQGEMIEARHWFPCYDYPNEKFTSEITCRVPQGMTVVSNGKQISSVKDPLTGLQVVHWSQDKPLNSYLIALIAGKFSELQDQYRTIPLRFYTVPSDNAQAPLAFKDTRAMVEFFEKEIGVPYPWDQYAQAVVRDFNQVGMENTSLTVLNDLVLGTADTEDILPTIAEYTSADVSSHELAHQWFGDLVTCRDWSHAWLNEGFATYYQLLFAGNSRGRDAMLFDLMNSRSNMREEKSEWRPIVNRQYEDPSEQFDHRAYYKASWVLHMLREELGADLFRQCVKTYIERHKFQTATTADFIAVVEEVSGRSLDRFFDQWLYKPGFPEIRVRYRWDERAKLAKVTVTQTQSQSSAPKNRSGSDGKDSDWKETYAAAPRPTTRDKEEATVFQFPLTLRFKGKVETVDRRVEVTGKQEEFSIPLKSAPEVVVVDPNISLLTGIEFDAPSVMLYRQLADKTDAIGRVIAAESLADKKSDTAVAKLKAALQTDDFYGVRVNAARALRQIHTDAALDALIASTKQKNALVRDAVVRNIGKYFHPRAEEALLEILQTEKNPAVVATALGGLGAYHDAKAHQVLVKFLDVDSYRAMIIEGALTAIKAQEDPTYIDPVRQMITKKADALTSENMRTALSTLATISRNEKQKDDVRNFIVGYVNSPQKSIQSAAILALGTLEDPKAIAVLKTFETESKDDPLSRWATWAVRQIRSAQKYNEGLSDLQEEVTDLQKGNKQLRKELDELKRSVKASQKAGSGTKSVHSKMYSRGNKSAAGNGADGESDE